MNVPTDRTEPADKAVRRKRKSPQRGVPAVIQQREQKPFIFGWGAHLNRHEREALKEKIALFVGIGLALALAAVIGWGWYQDNIATPAARSAANAKPIVKVGDRIINTDFFKRFETFEQNQLNNQLSQIQQQLSTAEANPKKNASQISYYQSAQQQIQTQLSSLASNTLNTLIDDATVLQRAAVAGVYASPKAISAQITQLEHNTGGRLHFQQFIAQSGLSLAEIREQVTADYLRTHLQTKLAAAVPHTATKVRVSHILVSGKNLPLARKVLKQAQAGANFAALVAKYSTDPSAKKNHGDLGYQARGYFVKPFENAAFSMKVGQIKLVKTQFGWHILKLTGRKTVRLNPKEYQQAQQNALNNWLLQQQSIIGVFRYVKPESLPGASTSSTSTSPLGNGTGQVQVPGQTGSSPGSNSNPSNPVNNSKKPSSNTKR